jgi:hypothetical protein
MSGASASQSSRARPALDSRAADGSSHVGVKASWGSMAQYKTTRRYACSADCRSRSLRSSHLCRVGLSPPATVGSHRVLTGSFSAPLSPSAAELADKVSEKSSPTKSQRRIRLMTNRVSEKHPFNDKQSQIAERKTAGEQGPGDHGKEAAEQKSPRPKSLCPTSLYSRSGVPQGTDSRGPRIRIAGGGGGEEPCGRIACIRMRRGCWRQSSSCRIRSALAHSARASPFITSVWEMSA